MGSTASRMHVIFRFGPFELSERDGELRKNGVRIKLQEQPFRVLVELLANAGTLVTREELQQKLWPADTFVDFDVGLNSVIRKIRQALGDDADRPPAGSSPLQLEPSKAARKQCKGVTRSRCGLHCLGLDKTASLLLP